MLKPNRVEEWTSWTHPRYIPSEHGGLISFVHMSGMPFSTYAADPSGKNMIGVQMHDVYDFDNPQAQRRPAGRRVHDIMDEQIKIIVQGEIVTDFIHPDATGQIYSGRVAYAGPSGLFTHDSSFGGDIVGIFLSDLTLDSRDVMIEGDIFKRDEIVHNSDGTYQLMTLGYPRKMVTSPGYARVRLKLRGSPGDS